MFDIFQPMLKVTFLNFYLHNRLRPTFKSEEKYAPPAEWKDSCSSKSAYFSNIGCCYFPLS